MVKEIRKDSVICSCGEKTMELPVDTVIFAVGQKPRREEAIALNYCAPEVYFLGDCVAPKNITEANTAAIIIARNIGRI